MNTIAHIKTESVTGPAGPTTAMMINLDIENPESIHDFLPDVIEQFKLNRTVAPPNTSMMLVTVIGNLSASSFSELWNNEVAEDQIVCAFMSLMQVADVVQGDDKGNVISKSSLLLPGHIAKIPIRKPWWKFW